MLDAISRPKKLFVNNLKSYRNYIHLDDVIMIIKKMIKKNLKYQVYNIGHENLTIKQMINIINKKTKKKINYIEKKIEKKLDSSHKLKKCKIYKEINFYPKLSFDKFLNKSFKI